MWTQFILFGILFLVSLAAVCDPLVVSYSIGKEIAIINMEAEEVHALKQACNKPIILHGAVYTSLNVVTADFGGNRAYLYNDNTGMTTTVVKDRMSIHYGTCQSMTRDNAIPVTTGMSKNFTSSELCINIEPELTHRYLGGHTNGGKIQINVTVHLAVCNPSMLVQAIQGTCKPLCDSQKELNNCGNSTGGGTNHAPTTSSVLSTITTHPFLQTPNVHRTTRPLPTSSQQTSPDSLTPDVTLATYNTPKSNKLTSQYKTSPPHINTYQTPFHKTMIEKPTAVVTSTKSNTLHTTSPAFIQTLRGSSNSGVVTLTGMSTSPMILTSGFTNYIGFSTSTGVSTTSHDTSGSTDRSAIGVVEGMYAVVGLLILLLLVAVVAVCIRKRNTKGDSPSLTYTGPQSALHWRDNWLVSYHNNHLAGDATSQTSEISCIHGNFALEEDSPSLCVDQYVDNERIKLDTDENPYDNPWPLVMLDSDFVRNNKRLGSQRSNEREETREVDDKYREEFTAIIPTSISDGNDFKNSPVVATSGLQRKRCSSMSRYLKHIGSFSRGKYDVAKVERNNSTKEKDYQCSGSLRIARSNSTYRSTHGSEKESNYRERRPSSICSDCSQSQACKDILHDEIQEIQDAMDTYDNHTEVVIDREQNKQGKTQKGTKNKWRVNTLYAIISSKNGSASQEVVLSRTASYDKHKNKTNNIGCRRNTTETGTGQYTTTDIDSSNQVRQLQKQDGQYVGQEWPSLSNNSSSNLAHFERNIRLKNDIGDKENVFENTDALNRMELGNVATYRSTKPELNVDAEMKRSAFLSTREMFEQNGSIKQDSPSHRTTGTGQFPK